MRKIFLITIILFLSINLFAISISATGEGKTREDSLANAKYNLCKELYGEYVKSTTTVDKKDGKVITFDEYIEVIVEGTLWGVRDTVQLIRGEGMNSDFYKATVWIPEDAVEFYKWELEYEKETILDLRNKIVQENNKERKQNLIYTMNQELNCYNAYTKIIVALGCKEFENEYGKLRSIVSETRRLK